MYDFCPRLYISLPDTGAQRHTNTLLPHLPIFWLISFHVFFLFTSLAVFVGGVWKPEKVLKMCGGYEEVWGAV